MVFLSPMSKDIALRPIGVAARYGTTRKDMLPLSWAELMPAEDLETR
jgi:hypothetical protein